jgi:hypothetical protein
MNISTNLQSAIDEIHPQIDNDIQSAENQLIEEYPTESSSNLAIKVGAIPWWVISTTVHSVLFLLAALITVSVPTPKQDNIIIRSSMIKKDPPKFDPMIKRDVFKNPNQVKSVEAVTTDKPLVVHEDVEVSDHFESDSDMDAATAAGNEDAISDIPLGGTGSTGSMGVGASGGMSGVFGYRGQGGRKRAVKRFGGSEATESAVEAALRWLARNQEPDGSWNYLKHGGKDKFEKIARYNIAMTGIATEAFLGAGYTHKNGKFRDTVKRALSWLKKQQGDDGRFAKLNYTQGLATLPLVEAYGMTKDPMLKEAAQKGVDAILEGQRPYEAWHYNSDPDGKKYNDTSVSSWQIQTVKSARTAGLKINGMPFQGMLNWIDFAQDLKGRGVMPYQGSVKNGKKGGGGLATTAIAAMSRMYIGQTKDHPGVSKAIKIFTTGNGLPKWTPKGKFGRGNSRFYYWYYATLACFQSGGEPWKIWNKAMTKELLEHQCQLAKGCAPKDDGSWPPEFGNDHRSGRVWTTAVGALIMEVYYRYTPMFGK